MDITRPSTWILGGLAIAVLGGIIMSLQDSEGGAGQIIGALGLVAAAIGVVLYVVHLVTEGPRED